MFGDCTNIDYFRENGGSLLSAFVERLGLGARGRLPPSKSSELSHATEAWENKKVLISLSNKESQKDQALAIGKTLAGLGFTLVGTKASFAIRFL